jgi:energy-coupling factor transporter ATP-binding protein EcfA2
VTRRPAATAIIAAKAAAFRYAGQATAVGPFDFAAAAGEFHLISGPSGCGKSTFARMLCGLVPHLYRGELAGEVYIGGRPSDAGPLWWLTTVVGFVGQNPRAQLLGSTVRDDIVFGLENLGLSRRAVHERLEHTLATFGLERFAERDPRSLSGGEQQRAILAAVMARRPRALVLDEPLAMLDGASAIQALGKLSALRDKGCAITAFEHREALLAGVDGLQRLALPAAEPSDEDFPDLAMEVPPFRVVVNGLRVELGGRAVLDGIDCTLAGGRVIGVVGANGSGKTTLLRTLVGLQAHTGRVNTLSSGAHHKARLGLCFQNPDCQIFNATVRQELRFSLSEIDEEFYHSVVKLLGLARYEQTPPLLLSEGEKKRLALATVLLRPGLSGICLDEPTLGQDVNQRRFLGRILKHLAAAGYLCVIATHDVEWAHKWSDEVFLLQAGRLTTREHPRAALNREDLRNPAVSRTSGSGE